MLEKISSKAWDEEQSPSNWFRMQVAPVYKKGGKHDPVNYHATGSLLIPGKIFLKVLLNRVRDQMEEKVKELKYGF